MKKAGLIGGLGPESTVEFYKGINERFQRKAKVKDHFPKFTIENLDVFEVLGCCEEEDYDRMTELLSEAVRNLQVAGAEFAAILANTPHIVFDRVAKNASIPMISIVDAVCESVKKSEVDCVGLIGTKRTMEADFFKKPFVEENIKVIVPNDEEIARLDYLIVNELEYGIMKAETKRYFLEVVERMRIEKNIRGIILGCTEIPLLIDPEDLGVVCFDTVQIHIDRIVDEILK